MSSPLSAPKVPFVYALALAFPLVAGGQSFSPQGSEYSLSGPLLGDQVRFMLVGGFEIGENTLIRWYVLHVIALPLVAATFMAVHFWRIRKDGGISGPL